MFRTLAKLRGRKQRKLKARDQNPNEVKEHTLDPEYITDDASRNLADSRNCSKTSLATSECSQLSNGDVIEDIAQYDDELDELDDVKPSKPDDTVIPADKLLDIFVTKHADEDRLFRGEFESLPAFVASHSPKCEYAKRPENKDKNRYKNVVTCDDSRVELDKMEGFENSDYINASYIDGYKHPRKFIAAQGPKENTVADFWRMIWERRCYVIVMITELRELGRKKCEQYWPQDEYEEYGKVTVQTHSTFQYGSFTKRLLKVSHSEHSEEDPRMVTQLQYRAWPDHGVPKTTSEIFRFRLRSLEAQPDDIDAGPIVVHCSAGVGRTGTYIALDCLLDRLKEEQNVDIYSLIADMRLCRTEMVQSLDQYVLLHKLITEHHLFGDTDITTQEFKEKYEELKKVDEETRLAGFDFQFNLLSNAYPMNGKQAAGKLADNEDKNRNKDVIPYEHSKVFVRMRPNEQIPLYVNASSLQAYDVNTNLIASQAPLENTVEDFWRVVIDNYVTCVVMLTPLEKDGKKECYQYWPMEGSVEFGEIFIHNDSLDEHAYFTESSLSVMSEKTSHTITHIYYNSWEEEDSPPAEGDAAILELASFVAKQLNTLCENIRPRVLIHCSDGAGRTGVLCAIINLIERHSREGRIDVFRSVKDLRDCRPLMVKSKEQYRFCYDVMKRHLKVVDSAPIAREEDSDQSEKECDQL
ncbi:receptor-type tyrosine-protein phosphatase alpha-like isoform X2 [Clavelina lepadiformis]|uniref:receptor-type tyrosine-protein phosphatase alpha-like isoform X2 n=1 Tax=Clavelina lepadiformis TaxID=159417 RepID=UPI00404266CA